MNRTISIFIWLAVLSMLVTGCGATSTALPQATSSPVPPTQIPSTQAPPTPTATPKVGGTLVIATTDEPDTLDCQVSTLGISTDICGLLNAGLVKIAPDGTVVPYLAEKWDISPDGLTYTFHLRNDVKFSNGDPMTANDFVYAYDRASTYAPAKVQTGAMLQPVSSWKALDDYTLQFVLTAPYFSFMYTVAYGGEMGPVDKKAVDQWGDQYGRHPVGVGPYVLKEWDTGEQVVLESNPDFDWGPSYAHQGPPYIETIEYRIIPEYSTIVAGLQSGEIDYIDQGLQAKDVDLIQKTGQFNIYQPLYQGLMPYLQLNSSKPPFDNLLVRQAFNLAIDRDKILQLAVDGKGQVTYGPISPSVLGYWPGMEDYGYHYNLDKAKALMQQAGYTYNADGMLEKGGTPLTVVMNTRSDQDLWVKTAEILADQYKALGVNIQIQQQDSGTNNTDVLANNFVCSVFAYNISDADVLVPLFASDQLNLGMPTPADKTLDDLLTQSRTTIDPTQRQGVLDEVYKRMIDQAYLVPIFVPTTFYPLRNTVKGAVLVPLLATVYFDDAYIATP